MVTTASIELARDIRRTLASGPLTEGQAKLYSQRLRRDMGRDGLASFQPGDVDSYLDEAMLLIQCGLLERGDDPSSGWRDSVKRAGEILEWLSQSSLKPRGAPLHLLAAAAYQLADYPAMALGHLRRVPQDDPFSTILREFLRGNFPGALEEVRGFWRHLRTVETADRLDLTDLTTHTFQHVVMCIGTVCAYLRTGDDGRVRRAVGKLEKLAGSLLHSRDPYSYILARLTALSCLRFVETSLWPQIQSLRKSSSEAAGAALVQFARSAFVNRRALVWPAQVAGIERLRTESSFVLCTPTGSGKTTVAALAVVQGLFADPRGEDPFGLLGPESGNLVLYLVPSRALAAEVEARLAEDLKGIAAEPVVITGLYGGVDWGPTDAWIQSDRATIVICTFEKADAILRYLGVLFLDRVRLVVVDEAHMVEQDRARVDGLIDGSSRAYRLEQLGARLLRARDEHGFRVLALSAVAARAAPALARWIGATPDAIPTTSSYRSTRQMLGRLEVTRAGQYAIRYALMDGRSLKFEEERRSDAPFVQNPFAAFPGGVSPDEGPEVGIRGPTLWAALQLAAQRPDGSMPSVLISVTQNIETFSATCADLLESWSEEALPNYWYWPSDEANDLWNRCLASAADYFSTESVEYRLLKRRVVVHHGKMPGLLARRLKTMIDRGYVRVIIATSTLSEGVNIPVNYLLIPSVCRGPIALTLQEFTNLIGRAGRPGVATEGSALVVLPERTLRRDRFGRPRFAPNRQWEAYQKLVAEIERTASADGNVEDAASSPLAQLLQALEGAWSTLSGSGSREEFETWLEQTAVMDAEDETNLADRYLDALDAFLIAGVHEVEELRRADLSPDQLEAELASIWRRTYAFAAVREEARLAEIWLWRGRAIKALYPDSDQRRRIYKTSLSPRSATKLIGISAAVRARLGDGVAYATWGGEERFEFICDVLGLLSEVPSFRIATTLGRRQNFKDWRKPLRWWLAKNSLPRQPAAAEITKWYDFVAQNFIYRGAWGLGSIIGLLMESAVDGAPIRALEIADWPRSGLPWVAFWIKELITWGTLEPVAAFLLARGDAIDRTQAESDARGYYNDLPLDIDANDMLDPRRIRDWVDGRRVRPEMPATVREFAIEVTLARSDTDYVKPRLTVAPIDVDDHLIWIDPAGYTLAQSRKPPGWPDQPSSFDFELIVADATVVGEAYLRHAWRS